MSITIKRVHEPHWMADGLRVLVDRLSPRGVSREKAVIDLWLKVVAPSAELRRWFDHDPDRWFDFHTRYARELDGHTEALAGLARRARRGRVTLVYGARDERFNNAVAPRRAPSRRTSPGSRRAPPAAAHGWTRSR
jgi:uncharacterized protein YeaO (DUF488 family)